MDYDGPLTSAEIASLPIPQDLSFIIEKVGSGECVYRRSKGSAPLRSLSEVKTTLNRAQKFFLNLNQTKGASPQC